MAEADGRRVAFVTGAGSGIGKGTALAFAAAGYDVALVDRDEAAARATEAEIAAASGINGTGAAIACDVADDASVAAAVASAMRRFGRIDAAFNAAGIDGEHGRMTADCTPENWNRVIAVNLTGMWHCLRHQIPAMLQGGAGGGSGGAIVNCASVAGLVGAATFAAYAASKHGVVGLTKAAALEYMRQGIRVNAVCPGTIETPMNAALDPQLKEQLLAMGPSGRMGSVAEIAATVLWLCGDGGAYVNGQAIAIDGGWTTQ